MTQVNEGGLARWLPGLNTISHYQARWLRHDLVAGLVQQFITMSKNENRPGIDSSGGNMSELDGFAATGWSHAQYAIKFVPGGENPINGLLLIEPQAKHRTGVCQRQNQLARGVS